MLVNTVIDGWGRPLNDEELHAEMMADTFVGGSETTTNALAAGMKLLIENKDVWHKLKADPDKYMRNFVEEVLRLESPVQSLMRFTHKDVELDGVTIPAGSVVNVRYGAANRDERFFRMSGKARSRPAQGRRAYGLRIRHAPLSGRPAGAAGIDLGLCRGGRQVRGYGLCRWGERFRIPPAFFCSGALKQLNITFEPKKR